MENQELPKKLSVEEIEQQNKNLEQKDDKIQQPIEKDESALLSDVNEKIEKKTQIVEYTKNKIDEIRNGLGLPPSDEIPPSIKTTQEEIGKLHQEKVYLEAKINEVISRAKLKVQGVPTLTDTNDIAEYKGLRKRLVEIENKNLNKATEKSEETKLFEKNLKSVIDNISSDSKKILDALDYRYQKNLTPLIRREDFFSMNTTIKNLGNLESKIDVNFVSNIIDNINQLNQFFDTFGIQETFSGEIKEEKQNLEILVDSSKHFASSIEEGCRKIPIEMEDKQMEAKSKELRLALQKLSEQSQKLCMFAIKLRENIR